MRISAVLVTVALAAAVAFSLGRGSAPDREPNLVPPAPPTADGQPAPRLSTPETAMPVDGRSALLRALERPAADRNRGVRRAMLAWLAADGARALSDALKDLQLADVAKAMTHIALVAYPEVFADDPSLLNALPDARQSVVAAIDAIAAYDPATARALIAAVHAGTGYGQHLSSVIDRIERVNDDRSKPLEDPHAELEAILAERNRMTPFARLRQLIRRVAEDDPVAATALVDSLPGPSADQAMGPLIEVWSQTDPEASARRLTGKNAQFAWERLSRLAHRWGSVEFDAASAFGDTFTGAHRSAFLAGLADAGPNRSTGEMPGWLSRYEGDRV